MAKTYEPIATTTLGSAQSSVTFSGIPQTYTDLVVVINGTAGGSTAATMRFNSDSGSNYSETYLEGNGSVASSFRDSNVTSVWAGSYYNTTTLTIAIHNIMNYTNATTNKTILSRVSYPAGFVNAAVGLWRNTSAITSITLATGANFSSDSTFTLYGIKAA